MEGPILMQQKLVDSLDHSGCAVCRLVTVGHMLAYRWILKVVSNVSWMPPALLRAVGVR